MDNLKWIVTKTTLLSVDNKLSQHCFHLVMFGIIWPLPMSSGNNKIKIQLRRFSTSVCFWFYFQTILNREKMEFSFGLGSFSYSLWGKFIYDGLTKFAWVKKQTNQIICLTNAGKVQRNSSQKLKNPPLYTIKQLRTSSKISWNPGKTWFPHQLHYNRNWLPRQA